MFPPDHIMQQIEATMARAERLQDRARVITQALGRAEWLHRRESPAFGFKADRDAVAASIRRARAAITRNGLDTWHVCAVARDPDAEAFASAGCNAAQLRADSEIA